MWFCRNAHTRIQAHCTHGKCKLISCCTLFFFIYLMLLSVFFSQLTVVAAAVVFLMNASLLLNTMKCDAFYVFPYSSFILWSGFLLHWPRRWCSFWCCGCCYFYRRRRRRSTVSTIFLCISLSLCAFFLLNTRSNKLAYALHLFETIIICFTMEIMPMCLCDYVLHLKTIIIIFFCFMFGTCLNAADIWWDYYIVCCRFTRCFRQHANCLLFTCAWMSQCVCECLSGVVGTLVLL